MGTEQRPYVGTWNIQEKKVVQHTPDCLVYINGDLTIPSVDTKGQQYRIDLQKFITGVQVDCANTPSGATASVSVSMPTHSKDPIARDANNILKVGLEVHIYMRGYFPVRGLFRGTGDSVTLYDDNGFRATSEFSEDQVVTTKLDNSNFTTVTEQIGTGLSFPITADDIPVPDFISSKRSGEKISIDELTRWAEELGVPVDMLVIALTVQSESGRKKYDGGELPSNSDIPYIIDTILTRMAYAQNGGTGHSQYGSSAWGTVVGEQYVDQITVGGSQHIKVQLPNGREVYRQYGTSHWHYLATHQDELANRLNEVYERLTARANGGEYTQATNYFHYRTMDICYERGETRRNGEMVHRDWIGSMDWVQPSSVESGYFRLYQAKDVNLTPEQIANSANRVLNSVSREVTYTDFSTGSGTNRGTYIGQGDNYRPKTRYDDLFAYPYYHVFHGVVTNVSISYSPGVQTATLQCGSMLHFWSYQNMSTNAAAFGARPSNSKNRMSLLGHNFTGKHPYEIIYTLFHDTAGAAGAVSFVLDQKTNVDSVLGENSLYSLNIKYWEKRFSQRVMNLRLHGATGALFNTLQATAMSKASTAEIQGVFNSRYQRLGGQGTSPNIMAGMRNLGLVSDKVNLTQQAEQNEQAQTQAETQAQGQQVTQAQIEQASFGNTGGFKNGNPLDLNIFMMEAYVTDIGQIASINLFESSYETKMDIANKVCEITGYEFYQDVDGDCVFKPPMYNLDTSGSRVYRIEDIDMISWSETEKEPDVTFMTTKGSQFANLAGTGVEGEWGVQGTFIDYPMVAKYGWRSGSFETAYFNDARQCFFACINRMAVLNASVNSGNASIPLRPELRPGYPIYIPTYDCFYYCTSISHSYQVGGACQTTLQLVAKRKKFYAPGDPNKSGIESIALDGFAFPPKPLQILRKDGYSKLSGFPNVVMTLDPELINPMFFVSGADFESLSNIENLTNLAKLLVQTSVEGNVFTFDEKTGTLSWKQGNETKYFSISDSGNLNLMGAGSQDDPYNLYSIAGKRETNRISDKDAAYNAEYSRKKQEIVGIEESINQAREELGSVGATGEDQQGKQNQAIVDSLNSTINKLTAKRTKAVKELETLQANAPQNSNNKVFTPSASGIDYLAEMLTHVRKYGKYDSNRFRKSWDNLESSANLLDLIGNKKANLSNGQLPGSYRYYSSAHPDPEHQGKAIAYQNSGDNSEIAIPQAQNAPLTQQKTAPQYVPSSSITVEDQLYQQPEAELREDGVVYSGIPLIGSDGNEEITPTDEIYSLRFQRVKGKVRVKKYVQLTDFIKGIVTEDMFYQGIKKKMEEGDVDGKTFVAFCRAIANTSRTSNEIDLSSVPGFETGETISADTTIQEFFNDWLFDQYNNYISGVSGFNSSVWGGATFTDTSASIAQYYDYQDTGKSWIDYLSVSSRTAVFLIGAPKPSEHISSYPLSIDDIPPQVGVGEPWHTAQAPILSLADTKIKSLLIGIAMDNVTYDDKSGLILAYESKLIDSLYKNFRFNNGSSQFIDQQHQELSGALQLYTKDGFADFNSPNGELSFNTETVTVGEETYKNMGYGILRTDVSLMARLGFRGSTGGFDNTAQFLYNLRLFMYRVMAREVFRYWRELENRHGTSTRKMKRVYKFASRAFGLNANLFKNRMANVWAWTDITTEVPVFPISDSKGYEVFGHYPYGRGLGIYENNPLDTILKTDPFIAVDRQTVENYVQALQGKTVTITNEDGTTSTLSGQNAITEASNQLEIALKNEYSPQELLDYGLASLNADNLLQISVQNWIADKSKDGVQKLTVENRAFSIADLGFLSDLASLPSDLRTSQSDVLLPAYSDNFADIVMNTSSNSSANLLEQLISASSKGAPKSKDMIHTIVNQENRSQNWSASQSALRGQTLETQNSADIIRDAIDTFSDNFQQTIQQGVQAIEQANEERNRAKENLDLVNQGFREPDEN